MYALINVQINNGEEPGIFFIFDYLYKFPDPRNIIVNMKFLTSLGGGGGGWKGIFFNLKYFYDFMPHKHFLELLPHPTSHNPKWDPKYEK